MHDALRQLVHDNGSAGAEIKGYHRRGSIHDHRDRACEERQAASSRNEWYAAIAFRHIAIQLVATPRKRECFDYRTTNRSEEHTSELQSLMRISYAVFCLKKKRY